MNNLQKTPIVRTMQQGPPTYVPPVVNTRQMQNNMHQQGSSNTISQHIPIQQNGMPQNGMPQSRMPQNGMPQNGMPQSRMPQNIRLPSQVNRQFQNNMNTMNINPAENAQLELANSYLQYIRADVKQPIIMAVIVAAIYMPQTYTFMGGYIPGMLSENSLTTVGVLELSLISTVLFVVVKHFFK